MLNQVKQLLKEQLGLSPAAVLVVTGLLAHIILNALLRKPMTSAWGIAAPLVLGIWLEAYEIWAQYRRIGLFADGNDPVWVILARHGLDVAIMVSGPVLLVGIAIMIKR